MNSIETSIARRRGLRVAAHALGLSLLVAGCGMTAETSSTQSTSSSTPASAADQNQLVADARATLAGITADPKNVSIHDMLSRSRAVVVFPNLVKGGFIVGVEGGRGVLFARHANSRAWGQPVFMGLADVSLGLQAGMQYAETIMVVYSDQALEKLLTDKVKLGADVSVAMIESGGGAEVATGAGLDGDIAVISHAKGLYGGVSVEGGVLAPDEDANRAYYGRSVTAREIRAMGPTTSPAVQAMHVTLGR